nr:hypothetical protein [Pseudomonas aeruginosa]
QRLGTMQISPKYAFNRGQHQDAIRDGLKALKLRFCDDEYVQGFEKVGAVAYAQFLGADDEKELMRENDRTAVTASLKL